VTPREFVLTKGPPCAPPNRSRRARLWLPVGGILLGAGCFAMWSGFRGDGAAPSEAPDVPVAEPRAVLLGTAGPSVGAPSERTDPPFALRPVRDVATGSGVGGLEFRSATKSDSIVVTSEAGELRWATECGPPRLATEDWVVVRSESEASGGSVDRTIWIGRPQRVVGRVVASSRDDELPEFARMELALETFAPRDADNLSEQRRRLAGASPERDRVERVARLGLDRVLPKRFDRATGEFEFETVYVPSRGFRASGGGWGCTPGSAILAASATTRVATQDVVVRKWRRFAGTVIDESGAGSTRSTVRVQLHASMPFDAVRPDALRQYGVGLGIAGQPDGSVGVMLEAVATTSTRGEFEVRLPPDVEGGVTVVVISSVLRPPTRRELSPADAPEDLRISLAPTTDSTVVLSGRPDLAGASVDVLDLTDRRNQLTLGTLRVGEGNRIPSAWLEPGRDYSLIVTSSSDRTGTSHYVRWRPIETLDLSTLDRNLTKFDRRVAGGG
jgi:hypothetical protein